MFLEERPSSKTVVKNPSSEIPYPIASGDATEKERKDRGVGREDTHTEFPVKLWSWLSVVLGIVAELNGAHKNKQEEFSADAESRPSLPHHVSDEIGKQADINGVQCVEFGARTHRVSGEME